MKILVALSTSPIFQTSTEVKWKGYKLYKPQIKFFESREPTPYLLSVLKINNLLQEK